MIKFVLFLALALPLLNSCSNQRFVLNKYYKVAKKPSYSEKKTFTNWGINEEQVLYNPKSYCPKDEILAKIEFKQYNVLPELFTLGYLQPRVIEVYCINAEAYGDGLIFNSKEKSSSFLLKVDQKINYTCNTEFKAMKKEFPNIDKDFFMHQCSIKKRKTFVEMGL